MSQFELTGQSGCVGVLGLCPDLPSLGVYIHVPFCHRRCDYCAFATYADRDHLMDRYVAAVASELSQAVQDGRLVSSPAVFVGGGTPSRLDAQALARLLGLLPCQRGAEVTVECNPEDVTEQKMDAYRAAGVTRISLGAQAQADHVLAALGRHHHWDQVVRAATMLGVGGWASWNLDLIFGAAGERDRDWEHTLQAVLELPQPPPHLSTYALSVERGTPLAADASRHPDDDVQARRYEIAERILSAAGYEWEEISNWAQPGHRCRYNNIAWSGGNYLGFGSAAHSHLDGTRFWNVRTPERYIEAIEQGDSPVAGSEILSAEQRRFERLSLALRTPAGVPQSVLPSGGELDHLVERRDGRAVLTVAGRMLANEVAVRLVHPSRHGGLGPTGILPR